MDALAEVLRQQVLHQCQGLRHLNVAIHVRHLHFGGKFFVEDLAEELAGVRCFEGLDPLDHFVENDSE